MLIPYLNHFLSCYQYLQSLLTIININSEAGSSGKISSSGTPSRSSPHCTASGSIMLFLPSPCSSTSPHSISILHLSRSLYRYSCSFYFLCSTLRFLVSKFMLFRKLRAWMKTFHRITFHRNLVSAYICPRDSQIAYAAFYRMHRLWRRLSSWFGEGFSVAPDPPISSFICFALTIYLTFINKLYFERGYMQGKKQASNLESCDSWYN